MKPRDIAEELQKLHAKDLPELMEAGHRLMIGGMPTHPKLAKLVFASLGQRLFILLEDVHDTFQRKLENGYFATAALTRSLMETATLLALLGRDKGHKRIAELLNSAEHDSTRRRKGLEKMKSAKDPGVAKAAAQEVVAADGVIQALQQIRVAGHLPATSDRFPNVQDRCKSLGEVWEFVYEATYRELCEAVHGSFTKITHAPSLAFRGPDQGGALMYEHARACNYALQFWGIAVLECCSRHPNNAAVAKFQQQIAELLASSGAIMDRFSAMPKAHTLIL